MKKLLVVVDMQRDFIDGALGSAEAAAALPAVVKKVRQAKAEGTEIVFTMDTHGEDYRKTQEGRRLPVAHCIRGTDGWQLAPELAKEAAECRCFEKPAFGSTALAHYAANEGFEEIELCGVCTDICVISNAMLLKAARPEASILVDADACAGVTKKSHNCALRAMEACQITVTGTNRENEESA